jgi:hypothetical protein
MLKVCLCTIVSGAVKGWGVVTGLLTDTGNVLATYILGQSMMAGKKTYFQIQQMPKFTRVKRCGMNSPIMFISGYPNRVADPDPNCFLKLDPDPDLH